MKKYKYSFILSLLFLIYIYAINIISIPEKIVLLEGENINLKTLFGIQTIQTSAGTDKNSLEKINIEVKLLGKISLKNIDVDILPDTKVVPVGKIIGLKLYTDGVLVVGVSEIETDSNEKIKPYEESGIKEGDTIIEINNEEISSIENLKEVVKSSNGNNLEVKYLRDGEILTSNINPIKDSEDEYKIGLWVRDAATGVGTLTYYDNQSQKFAALGHGIVDSDTNTLINIEKGDILTSNIISIKKGENGNPGEIKGSVTGQTDVGEVYSNTIFGIYGKLENTSILGINTANEYSVATRNEIEEGAAKVICMVENQKTKEYDIEIKKIYLNNNTDNKSMLIKVTDNELMDKTGGIIRGLSGAPIIQNGKFIGCITHVLVSDATTGYAVFGDLMIKQMNKSN